MNCYYHNERAAIGMCKACFKGLCPLCVVVLNSGLACKDSCVEKVLSINELENVNIKNFSFNKKSSKATGLFLLIVGLALTLFACIMGFLSSDWAAIVLFCPLGIGMISFGGFYLYAQKKLPNVKDKALLQENAQKK